VLAPASGTVIDCWDEYLDNQIGIVDNQNNWGNFIIIRSVWNYYIVLCHLANESLIVKPGDSVNTGQMIASCGNSGNSPQPHLHIHCQYVAALGYHSVPFLFTNCIRDGSLLSYALHPVAGQFLRPVVFSKALQKKFQFLLDDTFTFTVRKNGKQRTPLNCLVRMDNAGFYYLRDTHTDARLYFSIQEGVFCFYRFEGTSRSMLRFLFLALPRVPFTDEKVTWQDSVNPTLILARKPIGTFFKSFNHSLYRSTGTYSFTSADSIEGAIELQTPLKKKTISTFCDFSEHKGFGSLKVTIAQNTYELVLNEG
jgi:murein DD-endopeptidase MepM/ murein hydrolase activator NlpD